MTYLTTEDRRKLIDILIRNPLLGSRRGRESLFINAGLQEIRPMIDLEGEPYVVVTEIVHFLETYGRVSYEHESLGCFLNVINGNF